MGFLAGKRLLITGLLSNRSIAYGIARACRREGAELAFSYVGERFKDRITEFAREFDSSLMFDCDVADDAQIDALFDDLGAAWPSFDGFVHSIGFAPREAIAGDFLDGLSREAFRIAHDISAYSFPAMAKAALPRLNPTAALLTLTYLGAERAVPNYNTMGLPRRRWRPACATWPQPGPEGRAGERHLGRADQDAGRLGIKGFGQHARSRARPRAAAPQRDDRRRGQRGRLPAVDLAAGVTAEITYVDAGFSRVMSGVSETARRLSGPARPRRPAAARPCWGWANGAAPAARTPSPRRAT
jgi:enoyl-[acyl-carrier protein] reductase I